MKPFFKVKVIKTEKNYGKFSFEPLEQGFGYTFGTALRRTLLTSLKGAAIKQVKIAGVKHSFATIKGMKEDVVDLILNIKQIKIAYSGNKDVKLILEVNGPKQVKAGDIKTPANVEIINKDLLLANLTDKKAKLKMEMVVDTGVGYVPAEERESTTIGVIAVASLYSPIIRVKPVVESTRVGRRTDFDRLILEVWTNGTIKPRVAIDRAAKILVSFFKQIYEPVFEKQKVKSLKPKNQEVLELTLEEIGLPTRIVNALRKGGYKTVNDLVTGDIAKISKVKNLGKKSIDVINSKLEKKGVSLPNET